MYTQYYHISSRYIYSLRAFEEASILHYLAQREYIWRDFKRNKEEEEEEEKKRKETKKKVQHKWFTSLTLGIVIDYSIRSCCFTL